MLQAFSVISSFIKIDVPYLNAIQCKDRMRTKQDNSGNMGRHASYIHHLCGVAESGLQKLMQRFTIRWDLAQVKTFVQALSLSMGFLSPFACF